MMQTAASTGMVCSKHVLFFCFLTMVVLGGASSRNLAYSYGDYGPFYGGYSVSPQGAGQVSTAVRKWFPTATQLNVDVGSLLQTFEHPDFSKVAFQGSLHDHIVLLSQVLSVALDQPSGNADVKRLNHKLAAFLADKRRPVLHANAFSLTRMQKISHFLNNLDVRKANEAQTLYEALIEKAPMRPYEEAVVELTLLLHTARIYVKSKETDGKFLPSFLHFYFDNFVRGTEPEGMQMRPKLTPGSSFLLAKMIMNACDRRINHDRLYFAELLGRKAGDEAGRPDLRQAIAFEMDGIAQDRGRKCLDGLLESGYEVSYNRRLGFPTVSPMGRLWLKHSPTMHGWDAEVSGEVAVIRPADDPAISLRPGVNPNMQVEIALGKGGLLEVNVEAGRLLVVRIQQAQSSFLPTSDTDSFIGDTSRPIGDTSDTSSFIGDTDSFVSSRPDDSFDDSFVSDSTNDKVVRDHVTSLIFDNDVCLPNLPCRVSVQTGDMLLVMSSKKGAELSREQKNFVYRAWEGGHLENTLLQLAATLPATFCHVCLIGGK